MPRLYKLMGALIEKRESFVAATIFDKTGSAPRTAGAKMVVQGDGTATGTIGGGRLEAEAIKLAGEALRQKHTFMQSFDLTGRDVSGMDMICGGQGEILIDYVDAGDENNRMVYRAAAEVLERREKAWFVTILESIPGAAGLARQQCLVQPDGTLTGKVDSDPYLLEKLITGPAKISIHAEAFGRQRFLVEPLRQGGTVYIFGAGHVSQRIAALSETVGFRTVVMDDRADFANRERFPEPIEIRLIDSFRKLPDLGIDGDSYLVIVTRGHLYDKVILEQVLRSGAGYIGMIGSRIKRDLTYEELVKQGFRLGELARVYSPIGTGIGAETPEELAVSIVGELIMVRARRERRKQKDGGDSRDSCCTVLAPEAGGTVQEKYV